MPRWSRKRWVSRPTAVTLRESVLGKDIIGNNTGGSRSMVCTGSVCKLAAQKLIEQAKPLAAEALELEPSQLEYGEGVFRSRDGEQDHRSAGARTQACRQGPASAEP